MLFIPRRQALEAAARPAPGPTLALAKLRALCEEYDTVCEFVFAEANGDRDFLVKFSGLLWRLARAICTEIELLERDPELDQRLEEFRHGDFAKRVVRWNRMSPCFAPVETGTCLRGS